MVDRIIYHPVLHEWILEILGTAINYKSLLLDFTQRLFGTEL
jgi:hypothetical protein